MGYSVRTFLIAGDDTIWRFASNKFWRMLQDPASHCLPAFAGQRIRTADVIVELKGREPVQVVRRTYFILTFDPEGHIDLGKSEASSLRLRNGLWIPFLPQPIVTAIRRSSLRRIRAATRS